MAPEAGNSEIFTRSVDVAGRTPTVELHCAAPADLTGIRILVIMPSVPVQGMERSNLQIMKMLRERGADVLFITERTYGGKMREEVEWIGCAWTTAPFINRFEDRLHLTRNLGEMAGVVRAWSRAAWAVDRIYRRYGPTHLYVTNMDSFLYAVPTLWRARQPVVFRIPNLSDPNVTNVKLALYRWIWSCCIGPACEVIVCNSQYTRCQLERLPINPKHVAVIYNCVPERPHMADSDAPHMNAGHFNIVYVGRIRAEKGLKELFDVAKRLVYERDDVNFYFVGEYEWRNPFAEALVQEVRANHLELHMHFTGEIEDVFGLLRQCDLHVLPSMAESFPNVVLEAKSEGVPSVVFRSGGISEAVTHLVDGYVCRDKSAGALYEGIRYFLDNPAALKATGEAAKQSLERFSRQRVADEWAEVFKKA